MNCRQVDILIQQSLDGVLSPKERLRLDAHLAHCTSCQAAWDEYRHLAQAANVWVRRPLTEDPGEAFTTRVLARIASAPTQARPRVSIWLAWASAFVLLIGLVILSPYVRLSRFSLSMHPEPMLLLPNELMLLLPNASSVLNSLEASLRAFPQDASQLVSALSMGMTLPHWTLAALVGGLLINAALYLRATRRHLA